jgi:N-acyl amino acid synthase of PEP-CTERM/exosortase system
MSLTEIFDLGREFKRYFEIVPAFSDALKDEVYRVRHKVYCEDLRFEPTRPDERETDEYDSHSLLFLLRNVQTKEYLGCARIILTRPENRNHPLPFEIACAKTLDRSIIDPAKLCRNRIAEVSRLAVVSNYRRRKGEASNAISISDDDFEMSRSRRFPYIPISLYLSTFELARLNKIDILFVLTEERLARHFTKLGFRLKFIGSPVEHHGVRIPSMMDVGETISNMRANLRPLYRAIAADIERHLSGNHFTAVDLNQKVIKKLNAQL